jgi:hypothetical protein
LSRIFKQDSAAIAGYSNSEIGARICCSCGSIYGKVKNYQSPAANRENAFLPGITILNCQPHTISALHGKTSDDETS